MFDENYDNVFGLSDSAIDQISSYHQPKYIPDQVYDQEDEDFGEFSSNGNPDCFFLYNLFISQTETKNSPLPF